MLFSQVWLVVIHMIFLKDLSFRSSQSGPQGRELRPLTNTGPAASGRAKGSGLSFMCEDTLTTSFWMRKAAARVGTATIELS